MRSQSTLLPCAKAYAEAGTGIERVSRARHAAMTAVQEALLRRGLEHADFSFDANGAPLALGAWYHSRSHSAGLALGVVHDAPVGIDVERLRPMRSELLRAFLDEHECAFLQQRDELSCLRVWTAKEAVLKRLGLGLAGLSRCRLVAPLEATRAWLTVDQELCVVAQTLLGQYVLALHCAGEAWDVDWPALPHATTTCTL